MKSEPEQIRNSGEFMMPQTVSLPIWTSALGVALWAWSNVVCSRNFRGLLCMTAGLSIGIPLIYSMQSAVPIFYGN